MKSFLASLLILATCLSRSALGAAFGIDIHAARATAMATATRAHIDDASSVLYNPAGMIKVGKLLDVELGDTLVAPNISFTDPTTGASTKTTIGVVPPPHFYASYGINDWVSVGFGEFSPFGLVVDWPSNWQGRFLLQHVELKTYFLNPSVAVKLHDQVRVGAGIQIVRVTAELTRALNFVTTEGQAQLAAGGWAVGANFGFQVDAIPNLLSFGGSFRTPAGIDITGKAHFVNVPAEFASLAHDQSAMTTINLPAVGALGVAVWPIPQLRLAFDAEYSGWQRVQDLTIKFLDTGNEIFLPKKWKYVWNYHIGGEYEINQQWRARLGLLIDPTPSPNDTITPDLPDFTRVNIAAGGGYRWGYFYVDAAYQIVILTNNTSTAPQLPGSYKGTANIFGLTLGWRADIAKLISSR